MRTLFIFSTFSYLKASPLERPEHNYTDVGLQIPLEFTSHYNMLQMLVLEAQNLILVLWGFSLTLVLSILGILLFLPFKIGMLTLYHCM
jgi:hypothetical protein